MWLIMPLVMKKSDWMDVFLCAQCRFFIGTSSGLLTIAMSFNVPLVITNFLPGQAFYYFTSRDIIIPRLCWSKSENRTMNFREMVFPPIGTFVSQFHYKEFGLEVRENTPEEIRDVVQEMLSRFNATLKYTEEDENLQERFKALAEPCGELYGDKGVAINARIGRDFIRKHASLLLSERELVEVK